jgi:hypothetical protein
MLFCRSIPGLPAWAVKETFQYRQKSSSPQARHKTPFDIAQIEWNAGEVPAGIESRDMFQQPLTGA